VSTFGGATWLGWNSTRWRRANAATDLSAAQLTYSLCRDDSDFSWNAAFWDARNLALDLVALGYANVSWYRGGLEAWDVAGLPVTRLK
jgi:hypothetical protein